MARPKKLDGSNRKSVILDDHQMATVLRWQKSLGLKTMSDAIREIVDRANETSLGGNRVMTRKIR